MIQPCMLMNLSDSYYIRFQQEGLNTLLSLIGNVPCKLKNVGNIERIAVLARSCKVVRASNLTMINTT